MIVLPKTTETVTVLNVHGENGAWKKPKNLGNNKIRNLNIIGGNEKRNYKRFSCKGPIWLTSFNNKDRIIAETSNCCSEGMCFKSDSYFKSQTTLLVRLNCEGWDFSFAGKLEGLRTVTLGEVRWCKEISYKTSYSCEAGIRYLAPVY